ncbi:MAG: site-specific DNA-methyltransferase [Roseiflexus sp.]|nr:site-specific DNA-methyltransferase [Roseiflexus sp.]MDW8146378.1 DNA methyltransferase [Roseiflexaceae bacterium]
MDASEPAAANARQRTSRRLSNGEMNRLLDQDRPAHDWYRFVLSFPPHLVRDYVERFGIRRQHRVLDPFCGTGTTLVECKKLGIPSVGIEANAFAHFAAQVKTDWSPDPDELLRHSEYVADQARTLLEADGIEDDPVFICERAPAHPNLRTLEPEVMDLLLANSISPLPLHKVLVLLDCLKRHGDPRFEKHQLLALAKALAFSVSNLHFGPEVGVGPMKADAPVIAVWLDGISRMARDLRHLRALNHTEAVIHRGDARRVLDMAEPCSIDAVITSPPYPNEKDYTRTTRLESVLLGFIRNKGDLRALKQHLIRSNTRNVYTSDDDDRWIASHPVIQHLAATIEARRIELGKTSGFERLYARVTKLYFGGMARHLADLRTVLRPGAHLAYVVGDQASYFRVLIRTGELLADIARSLGYEVVTIDLFRTRIATATREQLREEVVILRWPGSDGG